MGTSEVMVFTDDMDHVTTAQVPTSGPGMQALPTGWVIVGTWNGPGNQVDWFYFSSMANAQAAMQQGMVK